MIIPLVPPPVQPLTKPGKRLIDRGARENLSLDEAEAEIAKIKQRTTTTQAVRLNVSWVIEE